jgi:hypothetical protein
MDRYLADLTTGDEADGQWANLAAEIEAVAEGKASSIEGDQITKAVFFLAHPLIANCDREMGFTCVDGEWRAEG